MKNLLAGTFIVVSLLFASPLIAGSASEKACEMVLCLYGEKTGFGGKVECDPAMAQYKKIMKKNKWTGKIMCFQTKELRLAQLLVCEQDDYDVEKLVDCDK